VACLVAINLLFVMTLREGVGRQPQPRGLGTLRMAEHLAAPAQILERGLVSHIMSTNEDGHLLGLVPDPKNASSAQAFVLHAVQDGYRRLALGDARGAADVFKNALLRVDGESGSFPADYRHNLHTYLAVSYLRGGEQDNCVSLHNSESCLLPIRGAGRHSVQTGSRAAVKEYLEILERYPDDLSSRWLLNIASMTLGEYPHGVAKRWLIPAAALDSEYDAGRFRNVATEVGLTLRGSAGGVIVDDFDNDGHVDILSSRWGLDKEHGQLRFLHNNGDGTFSDRTEQARLIGVVGGLNMSQGDYNNDGHTDVLIPRGAWLGEFCPQPLSLLINNGDGTFEDVTEQAGLLLSAGTQTALWGDFDNDGWLDLFIGYEAGERRTPCRLYRNNRDGTFTDVAPNIALDVVAFVKGGAWGDYDNDGLLDLYVSRLEGPNLLFRNNGPDSSGVWKPFSEVSQQAAVGLPLDGFATWFFDYDNDGWLDIYASSFPFDGYYGGHISGQVAASYLGLPFKGAEPHLYRNRGDGTFSDATKEARLARPLNAMGANFGDIDNDGFLDIYLGTGHPDLRVIVPNRMFRNAGGRYFQDVTTSSNTGHLQKGHGVAFADFNNDGQLDVYAVMGGALPSDVAHNALFANPGHSGHWLQLHLEGTTSNRSAIGARIKVTVAAAGGDREIFASVSSGGSFGASPLRQHVGLGDARAIRSIEIRWPGGSEVQTLHGVEMDSAIKIRQGEAAFAPLSRRASAWPQERHI
jgi:hypothetical protein